MRRILLICMSVSVFAILLSTPVHAQDPVLEPGPQQIPEWARQGKFRFTRLDGGPIEILKTSRSAWGKNFTPQEKEVLGNLYEKYGDQIADLLAKANINFVWITYSVGYSFEDEAAQRTACREITRKLHARGIKVAAYMCAVSMFWESMFKDVPQSVKWLAFDSQGVPFRYSGGRDPMRFIADVSNPDWVEYQKRRIGAIVDDGLDSIFFDNTSQSSGWNTDESMIRFFSDVRRYLRTEKHSEIPLFTNFGLPENRAAMNRMMEIVFNEHWQEPGVWGDEWNCSNVRRSRYERGLNPDWKPFITEYSKFHEGDRASTFMAPHSQQLAIAEAAAFGSAQARDMEGPFDQRLVAGDPAAMASWDAVGAMNGFLKAHEEFYVGVRNVTPLVMLLPADYPFGFAWDNEKNPVFDFLAQHNVLYAIKMADKVGEKDLAAYRGLIAPFYSALTTEQRDMIQRYQAAGGEVYAVTDANGVGALKAETSSAATLGSLTTDAAAQKEVLGKIASVTGEGTSVSIEAAGHVLANVTEADSHDRLLLHLLNYESSAATNVRVTLSLGPEFARLQGCKPAVVSPQSSTLPVRNLSWKGRKLQFVLPSLDIYAVVDLRR